VSTRPTRKARERAAKQLREILNGQLFGALCEPVRVSLVEFLTIHGRSDIATIAGALPQDRSVISRHLSLLHTAGVLRREKVGRRVFFEVDGTAVVARLEEILVRFRRIVPLCCPPEGG
jgi:ArsR family transcriptional regulator, nickel/cobalt-responsive transcriptional repressor